MEHSPKIFGVPSSETTGPIETSSSAIAERPRCKGGSYGQK